MVVCGVPEARGRLQRSAASAQNANATLGRQRRQQSESVRTQADYAQAGAVGFCDAATADTRTLSALNHTLQRNSQRARTCARVLRVECGEWWEECERAESRSRESKSPVRLSQSLDCILAWLAAVSSLPSPTFGPLSKTTLEQPPCFLVAASLGKCLEADGRVGGWRELSFHDCQCSWSVLSVLPLPWGCCLLVSLRSPCVSGELGQPNGVRRLATTSRPKNGITKSRPRSMAPGQTRLHVMSCHVLTGSRCRSLISSLCFRIGFHAAASLSLLLIPMIKDRSNRRKDSLSCLSRGSR
ncbi:hypothetical protein B0T25DRAFT_226114 [Lasiosphaeria hispida]|uniref:Uncharacterized protein n=1 Tax=Lasiosphaeria hispida TaxID=260671 RepID=A0AAJ0HD00_9PEZI|nr:hypothetical protein B0T25DRAFT_226114 [Lasiosphaeria hispida]